MNARLVVLLAAGLFTVNAVAEESEWIGMGGPKSSLALKAGADNEDQTLLGADAVFSLPNYAQISVAYFRSEFDDGEVNDTNDFWSIGLGSDPMATWSFGGEYRHTSSDSSVDTDDYELNAQFFPGSWSVQLGLITGEVSADNPFAGGIRNRRPSELTYGRNGLSLVYSRFIGDWQISLDGVIFDYEDDFPEQLANSRIGRLIAQNALTGLYDLIDHRVGIAVGYQVNSWALHLAVAQYRYAVSQQDDQSVSAGVSYALTDNISVSGLVASSLEDNIYYGESALRFYW